MGAGVHLCLKFTRTQTIEDNTKKFKKSQNLQRTKGEGMRCSTYIQGRNLGIISSNVVV